MTDTFRLNLIATEGAAPNLARQIDEAGGSTSDVTPYEPPPDEIDLYSDAQFEPLTILTAVVSASLGLKLIREAVKDLRGREVLVLDVTEDEVTARRVPLGGADRIILRSQTGVETFSTTQSTAIEEALLRVLGK